MYTFNKNLDAINLTKNKQISYINEGNSESLAENSSKSQVQFMENKDERSNQVLKVLKVLENKKQ